MDALGRLLNVLPVAADTYVYLGKAGGVTFVGVNTGGDTWTLKEAQTAGGAGEQVLAAIKHDYVSATAGAVWTKETQTSPQSAITTTASEDVIVIEVETVQLSDGYGYVKLTPGGSGTVVAIVRDLVVPRAPENLPAMV